MNYVFLIQVKCMAQQHIGQLLRPVAAAAHTAQKALQTGTVHGVQVSDPAAEFERILAQARCLCILAGQQALQQHAAVVLSVLRVPWQLAAVMQEAGLQLTTENLVAAARSRVEGLESWMVGPYYTKLEPLVLAVMTGRLVSSCVLACGLCLATSAADRFMRGAWYSMASSRQHGRITVYCIQVVCASL